jgi:hypothetical protein
MRVDVPPGRAAAQAACQLRPIPGQLTWDLCETEWNRRGFSMSVSV